jgi:hypothetical protein
MIVCSTTTSEDALPQYQPPDVTVYERLSSLENDVHEMKIQMGNLWDLYQKAQGVVWMVGTIVTVVATLSGLVFMFWDHL